MINEQIPDTCQHWYATAADSVITEMINAWCKHGNVTNDPVRGAATLTEEVGEVAAEALEATRKEISYANRTISLRAMCHELDQVIGYAIMLRAMMLNEMMETRKMAK